MKKTVTYRRAATTEVSISLERQKQALDKHLRSRSMKAEAEFFDMALSGMDADRPGLDALLLYCRHNPGTVVLVQAAERIARSPGAFAEINHRLASVQAQLKVVD